MQRAVPIAVLGALLCAAPMHVLAQDVDDEAEAWDEDGDDESFDAEGDEDEASDDEGGDEDEGDDADEEQDDAEDDDADSDAPRKWFFGPYFRFMLVPAFIPQLFLDEAPTVAGPGFGATATWLSDTVHYEIGLGYSSYGFEDPFRASGDPDIDTEWVDSSLGLVHLTGSMLWHSELSEKLAFEYGFGVDFGIVTGEMVRTEAYPSGDGYAPCIAPGVPAAAPGYCEPGPVPYDQEGAHYNVVEERVPPVMLVPMIPHLALRWTPAKAWAVKAEFAYGIIQLWLGASVAYAPDL